MTGKDREVIEKVQEGTAMTDIKDIELKRMHEVEKQEVQAAEAQEFDVMRKKADLHLQP